MHFIANLLLIEDTFIEIYEVYVWIIVIIFYKYIFMNIDAKYDGDKFW